eukprot:m.29153 g.29153  ORF g.29153 m.29153 type:complete len:756 (-) comp12085_c0_seq1:341-2608(-)
MGVLTVATPVKWEESIKHLPYVREHGVLQFMENYKKCEDFSRDGLLYGDELEYGILKIDPVNKKIQLSLRGKEIMDTLNSREPGVEGASAGRCNWVPEYGSWMVEATPAVPYDGYVSGLRSIETNMRLRRARLLAALRPDEIAPTMVNFPLLGVGDFAGAGLKTGGPAAASRFVPDEVINPHPRFGTLTANIRKRRGRNVKIMVPLFKDEKTDTTPEEGAGGSPGIFMDAMAFGMGCNCLQVTFQAQDVAESRHLYDQLAVMAPIMLALTAATPIHKGKLADWDARWFIIEQSVDCRTPAEKGERDDRKGDDETAAVYDERMAGGGKRPISKSRYSGISQFICNHKGGEDPHSCTELYNDVEAEIDEDVKATMVADGMDELLASHLAHLFCRDPLVIFEEHIEIDDATRTDHFENIQSTNWNSVRWKPPPPRTNGDPHIGWRTEFRSMETQITDYENAAMTVFVVLLSRVLLSFDLNLYIPISKNDENMHTAHERDAASRSKFWFRSHLAVPDIEECGHSKEGACPIHDDPNRVEQMTVAEIMMGKGTYFPGLIPLITAYIDTVGLEGETRDKVMCYLELIEKRSTGELLTPASWMRKFVTTHPDYKQDSIVPESVVYDLAMRCQEVGLGEHPEPELLGKVQITPIRAIEPYSIPLARIDTRGSKHTFKLLQRYAERGRLHKERKSLEKELAAAKGIVEDCEEKLTEIDAKLNESDGFMPGYERHRLDSSTIRLNESPHPAASPLDGAPAAPKFA